jgi:hypothetical protein
MIRNVAIMMVSVEIIQNEVAAKPEPFPPEWVRHPIIEIRVFPWGRVISNDWRLIAIVVVLDCR